MEYTGLPLRSAPIFPVDSLMQTSIYALWIMVYYNFSIYPILAVGETQ